MAELLQLKHTHIGYDQPEYTFYFYEGEVKVHYGVIDLPRDPAFEHWAMRAWLKGYRLDPETGVGHRAGLARPPARYRASSSGRAGERQERRRGR